MRSFFGGVKWMTGVAVLIACAAAQAQQADEKATQTKATAKPGTNALFEQLQADGVKFGAGTVKLPKPSRPDGLDAVAQQAALAKIADENHPVEALTRKAVVAPFILKIADEKVSGAARPRRVDLWFVAYGDVHKMTDETFVKQSVDAEAAAAPDAPQGAVLTDEELKSRGIMPEPDEKYLAATMNLFNRVRLSGAMRTMLTRTDESVLAAGMLDPRFAKDDKYPNTWRPIVREESGAQKLGPAQPYSSAAWYAKATRLAKPTGAVLVELHLVFDEPEGWFNGANLLRSKLPIVAQDGVRKIRRKIAEQGE